MNNSNAQKLIESAPNLYRQNAEAEKTNFDLDSFECEDGWFQLLWDLSEQLEREVVAQSEPKDFYAVQVKEKFGTVRFYMNQTTHAMDQFIEEAEKKSSTTCEQCGAPGEIRGRGWLRCLCNACRPK